MQSARSHKRSPFILGKGHIRGSETSQRGHGPSHICCCKTEGYMDVVICVTASGVHRTLHELWLPVAKSEGASSTPQHVDS